MEWDRFDVLEGLLEKLLVDGSGLTTRSRTSGGATWNHKKNLKINWLEIFLPLSAFFLHDLQVNESDEKYKQQSVIAY